MLTDTSYTQYRARRLGLPAPPLNPFARPRRNNNTYTAPAPAPGGIQGWIQSKISGLRNTRTSAGAYESTGLNSRDRRGFGPLDPDEAWDARVGNEADYAGGYYEEQELGLHDPASGPYGGSGYGHSSVGIGGIGEGRGRSRSRQRELDDRYDEEMHADHARNPFGDNAERSDASLRGVSPRPMVDTGRSTQGHKANQSLGANDDSSPTERRSAFQEQM